VGRKLKFIVSDLHIGAGHTNKGGNLLEDFRASRTFVDFLHAIWHESERDRREVELIINGDFFEFLQVPAVDDYDPTISYPKEAYLDSSQEASIKRLNIIAKGHSRIFDALSDFIHVEAAQRSITIIKGNHDVHLYWPGVKSRLREILGASGTRGSLLRFADEFISREKIYVEHSHQRAEKMNGYYDSFDPRSPDDPDQLYYPAGSRFVIDFFNKVEPGWWFVDHIKPIPTLIWYALKWDFDFACQALVSLIRYAPALALEGAVPEGGIASGPNSTLEDLEDEVKHREISQRYTDDSAFRLHFHQQVQQFFDSINLDEPLLTNIVDDPLEMGHAYQNQQHALLRHAAQKISEQEGAKIILFGHTHYPIQEKLSTGSTYINTGSWVEDFSDATQKTWEALFNGSRKPSHPPKWLPYARLDYNENDCPKVQLLYFNRPTYRAKTEPNPKTETQGFFEKNLDWMARLLKVNTQQPTDNQNDP